MSDNESIKRCAKCKEYKPVQVFGKDAHRLDGLNPYCKQCRKSEYREKAAKRYESSLPFGNLTLPMGKTCTKCGEWKLYEEFHVLTRRKDGRRSFCALCSCAATRQYYELHNEQCKEASRTYRKLHLTEVTRRLHEWREANREHLRIYARKYAARNLKRRSITESRRRGRRLGAYGDYTRIEWLALCESYDHRCLCCGEEKLLTADHVIPLSKGGANSIDNIQPLCQFCNSRKYTDTTDYR